MNIYKNKNMIKKQLILSLPVVIVADDDDDNRHKGAWRRQHPGVVVAQKKQTVDTNKQTETRVTCSLVFGLRTFFFFKST